MTEYQKEKDTSKVSTFIYNKRNRSVFFLILSVLVIVGINATLPLVEGSSHYTVEPTEMTYGEYEILHAQNDAYALTWGSKTAIASYREAYAADHDVPTSEVSLIEIPDEIPVTVNTKYFYEYTFWYISTAISLGSAIILFYSLFNFLIVRAKELYKKYIDLNNEVEKMRDQTLDPVTFEPWMEYVFNYRRKIEQHKANVKYKLDKLEQKTPYKHKYRLKRFYSTDPSKQEMILVTIGKLSKQEQKYKQKKDKLLTLLETDYIENYVVNGSVKHFKYIHPMFIYNGVNIVGKTIDSYSLIKSDSERLSRDAGKKVTASLTISLLFAVTLTVTAIASIGQSPLWIIINVIAKVAPLVLQIPMAYKYSDDFMEGHVISNLLDRRSIGLLYLADTKKGVSIEDPAVVKLKKLEAEEKLKKDKEEYLGNLKVVNMNASTN